MIARFVSGFIGGAIAGYVYVNHNVDNAIEKALGTTLPLAVGGLKSSGLISPRTTE